MDFVVLAYYRMKLKESKNKDKYLDLARELKYYGTVTGIPIVIDTLGTIPKGVIMGLEDGGIKEQFETIQTTELLRFARILK